MKTILTSAKSITRATMVAFLLLIASVNCTMATHVVGGEITYEWVTGNTYLVKTSFYRDCSGVSAPSYITFYYRSVLCGLNGSATMSSTGIPDQVTPICQSSLLNSTCNGGTLYGVEQYNYEGLLTLPGNCSDWEIYYDVCCRNGSITNLTNASSYGNFFLARLNNLDVPFNNSVTFGSLPINIINNNNTISLDWNTTDTDGDSLIYELVPARDGSGPNPFIFNIPYQPGLSFNQPFQSSLPTTLDAATGILSVTPNAIQNSVVNMKISEYRNGFLIGEVYRDFEILVLNSTNNLPVLSGINGTTSFTINGCPGDTIAFTINGSDPDPGQTLSLSMNNAGTSAGMSSTPGINPTGSFFWIPATGDISAAPYNFIVSVNDDHCDYFGTQNFLYQVYVNGCNTNDVWPGDANADGDANLFDLLPIGIAYNDNGPVRPSASLSWTAQPCPDWTNDFISGINHKHADTNGDGIINIADTTAVFQNYGLNHPLRTGNPNAVTVADLLITASDDTVGLIHTVNFDVSFATPVDSIYGLAFRLYFDPALIDLNSVSVSYPGSVFGTNAVDMIKVDRSQGMNGFVDIALTRINQLNITGTGPVARVTIVTTDNVSGKVTLTVTPFDIVGISLSESDVQLNGIGDGVTIDPNYVGFNDVNLSQLVQVYPSPAHDYINFNFSGTQKVDFIRLYDVAGKEVLSVVNPASDTTIDIKTLSKGTYLLKATIGGSTIYKKIMVF